MKIVQTSYVVVTPSEKGTALITKFQIKGLRLRQKVLVNKEVKQEVGKKEV